MCGETRLRPCQLSPVIVQLNCGVIGVSEYKRMTRTTWQRPQVADAEANALSEALTGQQCCNVVHYHRVSVTDYCSVAD